MKSYIVTCRTSNGDLKERSIEANNHLAAAKAAMAEGFEVVAVDRDDTGGASSYRSRKRVKRIVTAIVVGVLAAIACVAVALFRYRFR